jgi:hypothetical protein
MFHVDALPGRRANRWLILAGFFATILNACYLIVKYRFILNANQIQAIPITIGYYNSDTNSLTQSALVTIVIFLVRSLFVYAFSPSRFISVVGAVGLIIETTKSTPHRSQTAASSSLDRMASRLKRVKYYQVAISHNPRASVAIQADGLFDLISHSNDYRSYYFHVNISPSRSSCKFCVYLFAGVSIGLTCSFLHQAHLDL